MMRKRAKLIMSSGHASKFTFTGLILLTSIKSVGLSVGSNSQQPR